MQQWDSAIKPPEDHELLTHIRQIESSIIMMEQHLIQMKHLHFYLLRRNFNQTLTSTAQISSSEPLTSQYDIPRINRPIQRSPSATFSASSTSQTPTHYSKIGTLDRQFSP